MDNTPHLTVVDPKVVTLWNDTQKATQEANRPRRETSKARFAREKLARESNLAMAPKYRPCPDGCGLTLLWANPGYHPTPENLESEGVGLPGELTPWEYPLAVSRMPVLWARGELRRAQNGKETKLSIPELEALANTPLEGLRERAADKKAVKKLGQTVSTTKPRAKEA